MAIINQSNILNLQPGITAPVVVHMSEGDSGTKLSFKLIDGTRAWTDPGNVVAAVHGRRQDGAQFGPYACVISGDTVSFETDPAMAAVAGSGIAQIVLTDSNSATAGSANFAVMIERATFPMGVTYTNDKSVYEAILAYVQTIPAQVVDDYTTRITDEATARMDADAAISESVTELGNRVTTEVAALTTQDNVLSARMDSFARLPDGSLSTAADAELVDIRVQADGSTASTAGDAVRAQVAELKDGFDAVIDSNTNYRHTDIPVYQTITGWELKGDGASSQASGFIIRKYKVTAGDLIYLKIIKDGNGTFQFQSATNVPGNVPNPYLVGAAHTSAIDGYVIAPSGATYLIVSQLADNTANVIQNITYDYDMDTNLLFMMGNPSFTNKIFVVNGSTITIQSKPRLFLYYKGKTYTFPGDVAQEYTLTNGKTLVFDTDALISGGINVSSISQIFYLVDYAAYSDKCIPVCNYRKDSYTDRLFWSPLFAQYYYENLTDDSQTSQQIDNRLLETYLIGHGRDYYTAPENTLPLWELQRSRGLNVLEGDVAVTSDGIPVLLHDTTIDRTSDGTGNIADMTYAQASQYNYNAGRTSYGNVALPTLAEFLSYAHKYNMCVELDMAGHSYTDANIRTIITMVIEKGMLSRTVFTMSASDAYQKVLSVDARCIVMATNVTTTANIDTALSYKAKFVSIPFASLTSALCDYAHSKGMLVKTWTIDTASDCLSAFETGADCADVDKISYDDVFGVQ